MSIFAKIKNTYLTKDFILFIFCGGMGTLTNFVFSLLISAKINPTISYIFGYAMSLFVAYALNAKLIFHHKISSFEFGKFVISYIPNFLILFTFVLISLNLLHWNKIIVYALAGLLGLPITFLLVKIFTFKKEGEKKMKTKNNFIKNIFPKSNPKLMLLNGTYVLCLLISFCLFVQDFNPEAYVGGGYASWNISEFLINYHGGFVRRGLLGEVLFFFADIFHLTPTGVVWVIKIISAFCFAAVCIFFVRAFVKKGYTLYILPLCFFLGMGILSMQHNWIRKDYLLFCFFIPILWVYGKEKLSDVFKFLIINALSVFIILTHESFAFFTLPILFVLLFNDYRDRGIVRSFVSAFLFLLPSVIAFLLTYIYCGDTETAQAISSSWNIDTSSWTLDLTKPWYNKYGAIESLRRSTDFMFKAVINTNFRKFGTPLVPLVIWGVTFPAVYYIATNALLVFRKNEKDYNEQHKTVLSSILIFQLFCLLPLLFSLFCDWGRGVFYWITSSFALFLIIPMDKWERIIPEYLFKLSIRINGLANILLPRKRTLAILMLFIGISGTGIDSNIIFSSFVCRVCLLVLHLLCGIVYLVVP